MRRVYIRAGSIACLSLPPLPRRGGHSLPPLPRRGGHNVCVCDKAMGDIAHVCGGLCTGAAHVHVYMHIHMHGGSTHGAATAWHSRCISAAPLHHSHLSSLRPRDGRRAASRKIAWEIGSLRKASLIRYRCGIHMWLWSVHGQYGPSAEHQHATSEHGCMRCYSTRIPGCRCKMMGHLYGLS